VLGAGNSSLVWSWVINRFQDSSLFKTVASRMRYTATASLGTTFIARGLYVHY
jgi:hypothetical protein